MYTPLFNDPNGLSMGTEIAAFGQGLNAPLPVKAPVPVGMDMGTPLTTTQGMMPPVKGGTTPAAAAPGGGGFWNNFSNLAQGLSGLGQLYIGLKSLGIAKDQLAFSKEAYQTNLNNQRRTYNTALEDRIRSRYVAEGRSSGEADAYLAKNNL